ncbi:MAG: trehalose/maltose transport system substrate-binding protein [bacterium]
MTEVAQGWPFLVARGRRVGYRTVLAPPFLPGVHAEALGRATGALPGAAAPQIVEVDDPQAGRLSVGYRSQQLTGADLAEIPRGELLTDDRDQLLDEHGRPLEIVYGVVAREPLEAPLHPGDLATAREQAIASYGRFLADEDGHRVEASTPFALRTGDRRRAAPPRGAGTAPDGAAGAGAIARDSSGSSAGGTAGAPPAPGRPATRGRMLGGSAALGTEGAPPAPGRPVTRGRVLGGAAALGVAVLAGALLAGQPSTSDRDRAVDPAWLNARARGTIRLCTSVPASAAQRRAVRDYNRSARGSTAVLVKLAATRGTTGAASAAPLGRGSGCDVVALDVVALTPFASRHLLYDMTSYLRAGGRQTAFEPWGISTARYDGRLWGVPERLDAAVLYYRADRVHAPRSWQDVYREARPRNRDGLPGLRLQAGEGESLTVAFLELAYAAGAKPIVSADGRTAHVDQPPARAALAFLRDAIRDRVIPAGENGSVSVYERGRTSFLRGPASLAGRLLGDSSGGRDAAGGRTVAAGTAVVALPPWRSGGRSVSILTGDDLVIPRSARSPAGALHLVEFLTSAEQVRRNQRDASLLPVRRDVASGPGAGRRALVRAIDGTHLLMRPQLPRYAEVSAIVSAGIHAALRRPADPATLTLVERAVQRVLDRAAP